MNKQLIYLLAGLLAACPPMLTSCTSKTATPPAGPAAPTAGLPPTGATDRPIADARLTDAARFVAGLPVADEKSGLYALTQTKEWKNHARNMDQIWNSFQQSAPKVLSFTQNELAEVGRRAHTLFYPFGGPDFLFANAFFPEADTYFLIGLESTGSPIEVRHPSARTYKMYQDAVSDVLSLSFFRTRDMSVEPANDSIDGVIPIISMLMARTDKEIVSIQDKRINDKGEIVACNDDGTPLARRTGLIEMKFFRTGTAKLQTLYYYATDLSNEGLARNTELVSYIGQLDATRTATFIKSASYLMHAPGFSTIRDLIIAQSGAVVQDDSGIPIAYYGKDTWDISLYGTFYKPVADYAQYPQPALRDAYQLGEPKPLNFRIGFARQSNLQVVRRR